VEALRGALRQLTRHLPRSALGTVPGPLAAPRVPRTAAALAVCETANAAAAWTPGAAFVVTDFRRFVGGGVSAAPPVSAIHIGAPRRSRARARSGVGARGVRGGALGAAGGDRRSRDLQPWAVPVGRDGLVRPQLKAVGVGERARPCGHGDGSGPGVRPTADGCGSGDCRVSGTGSAVVWFRLRWWRWRWRWRWRPTASIGFSRLRRSHPGRVSHRTGRVILPMRDRPQFTA
jgi:hypothetical protein